MFNSKQTRNAQNDDINDVMTLVKVDNDVVSDVYEYDDDNVLQHEQQRFEEDADDDAIETNALHSVATINFNLFVDYQLSHHVVLADDGHCVQAVLDSPAGGDAAVAADDVGAALHDCELQNWQTPLLLQLVVADDGDANQPHANFVTFVDDVVVSCHLLCGCHVKYHLFHF